jgi:hypothetical protein
MMVLTFQSGALQIALDACATSMGKIKTVYFVLSDDAVYDAFKTVAETLVTPNTQPTPTAPDPAPDGGPSGPINMAEERTSVQAIKVDAGGEDDVAGKGFGAAGESVTHSQASVAAKTKVALVGGDVRKLRTWCPQEALTEKCGQWL